MVQTLLTQQPKGVYQVRKQLRILSFVFAAALLCGCRSQINEEPPQTAVPQHTADTAQAAVTPELTHGTVETELPPTDETWQLDNMQTTWLAKANVEYGEDGIPADIPAELLEILPLVETVLDARFCNDCSLNSGYFTGEELHAETITAQTQQHRLDNNEYA